MKYDEFNEGSYRIFALAAPSALRDGYVASVIVKRLKDGAEEARIAYREDCLAGGKAWPSPSAARRFATAMARAVIHHEPHRLAC
jgi:hypothetical protein